MKRFLFILLTSCCISLHLSAQSVTIAGKVLDEKGNPLPGANILVKGTTTGTVSNVTGDFTIATSNPNAHLVVTFIGYVSQEISLDGRKKITVELSQSTGGLNEVVVVAYGTQKKATLTGAVGTVPVADVRKNVNDNTLNDITGRTPGVRISQLSSQPGMNASSIDIRGFASYQGDGINAQQTGGPLFVIDGIPTTDASQFSRLDPNEIESFSVLKDGTAAIYGVQAANGVILVTTRKGSQGRVKVDYSGNYGIQVITKYPQLSSATQYAQLYDELQQDNALSNNSDPSTPTYTAQQIQQWANGTLPSADWTKVLFRNRSSQLDQHVTISGGTDRIQSFTSLGYYQQEGEIASGIDNDKKYNLRQNVTAKIANGLTGEVNLGFNDVNYYAPAASLWNSLIKAADGGIPPIEPVYANGNPLYLQQFPSDVTKDANIAGLINKNLGGYNNNNSRVFSSIVSLNYLIPGIDGLSAKGQFGYTNNYSENYTFSKAFNEYNYTGGVYVPTQFNNPSNLNENFSQGITDNLQLSLNYDKHFGKHHINLLGLYEQTYNSGDNISGSGNYLVDLIPTLNTVQGGTTTVGGTYFASAQDSYVGRLDYDYDGKYIIEGAFREEGSSLFGPGHQWGFFPTLSGAYRISEEPFMKKNVKWIDNLKIRASYGRSGDDSPARGSTSFPLWQTGYIYPAGGSVYSGGGSNIGTVFGSGGITKGISWQSYADPDLTWYQSAQTDIGIDASFWNGKLTFTGDVFRRNRTGLLATSLAAIPSTFGASVPATNINSDRTEGWEVEFGHTSHIGQVTLHVTANAGYSRTELMHYEETTPGNPYDNYRNKYTNRYTDQIWGYVVTGQFQNQQQIYSAPIQDGAGNRTLLPGDYKYADLNGDGIIDQRDQKVLATGGNRPLVYFGSTIDLSWKAFDLSFLLQGATDYHVSYQDELGRPFYSGANPLEMYNDRWHLTNVFDPNSAWVPGKYPAMGERQNYKDVGFNTIGSGAGTNVYVIDGNTYNIYDATYIRLKQLQFSYTLPSRWYTKAGISKISVVATGYNLLTWTKSGLKNFDPEYSDQNLYGYNYPITANFNLGVHVTF